MTGPKVPPPNQLLAATGSYVDRGEAEPSAGQRVTDEQLTAWDAGAPIHLYNWHTIARALIRDLRESRAREAELAGLSIEPLVTPTDTRVARIWAGLADVPPHLRGLIGQMADELDHARSEWHRHNPCCPDRKDSRRIR